jgi:hypothetical protein
MRIPDLTGPDTIGRLQADDVYSFGQAAYIDPCRIYTFRLVLAFQYSLFGTQRLYNNQVYSTRRLDAKLYYYRINSAIRVHPEIRQRRPTFFRRGNHSFFLHRFHKGEVLAVCCPRKQQHDHDVFIGQSTGTRDEFNINTFRRNAIFESII